jgi:hypothetical protein
MGSSGISCNRSTSLFRIPAFLGSEYSLWFTLNESCYLAILNCLCISDPKIIADGKGRAGFLALPPRSMSINGPHISLNSPLYPIATALNVEWKSRSECHEFTLKFVIAQKVTCCYNVQLSLTKL